MGTTNVPHQEKPSKIIVVQNDSPDTARVTEEDIKEIGRNLHFEIQAVFVESPDDAIFAGKDTSEVACVLLTNEGWDPQLVLNLIETHRCVVYILKSDQRTKSQELSGKYPDMIVCTDNPFPTDAIAKSIKATLGTALES